MMLYFFFMLLCIPHHLYTSDTSKESVSRYCYGPLYQSPLYHTMLAERARAEVDSIVEAYSEKKLYKPFFSRTQEYVQRSEGFFILQNGAIRKSYFNQRNQLQLCPFSFPPFHKILNKKAVYNKRRAALLSKKTDQEKNEMLKAFFFDPRVQHFQWRYYTVELLLSGASIKDTSELYHGGLFLQRAVQHDDVTLILFLLQKGINPNQSIMVEKDDQNVLQPLIFDARNRWTAQLLIAFGVNMYRYMIGVDSNIQIPLLHNVISVNRNTFLHDKERKEEYERRKLLEYYIRMGMSIRLKDHKGQTALHTLFRSSYIFRLSAWHVESLFRILTKNGVPLDSQDYECKSPCDLLHENMNMCKEEIRGRYCGLKHSDINNRMDHIKQMFTDEYKQRTMRAWNEFFKIWFFSWHDKWKFNKDMGMPLFLPVEIVQYIKRYVFDIS